MTPCQRVAAEPRQTASVRLRHRTAFWVAAFALLVMLAFSAVPTPLYPSYQARDGFSSFMITVIFATYPVGVVISLFTVGHLSDWHGRRRLVLPALGGAIVSALVFIFWRDVPGLLVGRFISGLAVGAVTASATAWIAELHAQARPDAAPRFAEVVATAANLGGIGVGPLVSGMLVAWVADPFTVPFLVFIAALLVAAAMVLISPETREPVRPRPAWRPQRVSVPADARGSYLAAAITAAISFASFALFTSLAPTFLAGTLHHTSPALAGATAFIVFASGAAGQMFVSRRPIPVGLTIGTGLMLSGLAIVVLAVWLPDPSLALFLSAARSRARAPAASSKRSSPRRPAWPRPSAAPRPSPACSSPATSASPFPSSASASSPNTPRPRSASSSSAPSSPPPPSPRCPPSSAAPAASPNPRATSSQRYIAARLRWGCQRSARSRASGSGGISSRP